LLFPFTVVVLMADCPACQAGSLDRLAGACYD